MMDSPEKYLLGSCVARRSECANFLFVPNPSLRSKRRRAGGWVILLLCCEFAASSDGLCELWTEKERKKINVEDSKTWGGWWVGNGVENFEH